MKEGKYLPSNKFDRTIRHGVVLVDFSAGWCGPCRVQEPITEAIAKQFEGKAIIAEINVDDNRETAIRFGIQSIPTLILFKNGQEIQRFIGLQTGNALSEAIEKVLD